MLPSSWRKWLNRIFKIKPNPLPPRPSAPLRIEELESRWVPSISATGQNLQFVEGVSNQVLVATFTDTTPSPTTDYTASIDWGDNVTTAGSVAFDAGTNEFNITGSHAYAEDTPGTTPLPITVSIQETTGDLDRATATSTASVAEADLTVTGGSFLATEGTSTGPQVVATFTDPGSPDEASAFTATIDWGDGTTDTGTAQGVTITGGAGSFVVSGTHSYADEGTFNPTVTVTETGVTNGTASASGTATVAEGDVLDNPISAGQATEGTQSTFQFVFTDTNTANTPDDFTASIDWGDSTPPDTGTVTGGNGTFTVTGTHSYADEGAFSATATLTDDAPGTATGTATQAITVAEGDTLTPQGTNITATEGASFSGPVATFTDTNTANTAGDFTATIDWGDGTTTGGAVSGSNGTFSVDGSHTYAEDGAYNVSVTLSDDAPGTATATATSSADVAEADLTVLGGSFLATEGTSTGPQVVATFTDPGSLDPASAFDATIDWGDGTTDTGTAQGVTITGEAGIYTVSGTHSYADEGTFNPTVTVTETGVTNGTASATDTVTVSEGDVLTPTVIQPTGSTPENVSGSGDVATFTDTNTANTAADFTATIDWGDGTTDTGTVSGGSGSFTVSGTHTYADEGIFFVTTTLSDDAPGTATATATTSITITEADNLTPAASQPSATIPEGDGAGTITVAVFSDTGYPTNTASDFSASIDWGDGTSSSGTVSTSGDGNFTVSGSHAYADEGDFTVTVGIADVDDDASGQANSRATATNTVTVTESDTLAVTATPGSATEGQAANGVVVATFTTTYAGNPAADFSAEILWGDGQSSTGTVSGPTGGPFTVTGTHFYADEGQFTTTVIVSDDAPGTATAQDTGTVTVVEGDVLTPAAIQPTLSGTEGSVFSDTVATFTDTNVTNNATDFTATIDWGDGITAAGTVSGGIGSFSVSGSHTYADEGVFNVNVTLSDDAPSTATATATSSITIAEADVLTGSNVTLTPTEGNAFSGTVATFTDTNVANTATDFTASIVWGDGTTTAGTVSGSAGSFSVSGSHTYVEDGTFNVSVTLTDNAPGTATATATGTASVSAVPIANLTSTGPISGNEFTPLTNLALATFTHANGLEPTTGLTASINWGDGTSSAGTITQASPGGAYSVQGSHTYTDEKGYAVTIKVTDGTQTASVSGTATILEQLLPDGTRGSADQRFVSELYRDLLQRPVDPNGLLVWTNTLHNLEAQGASVAQAEAQVAFLIEQDPGNEYRSVVVRNLYQVYLHRAAGASDAGSVAGFANFMAHGGTDEQVIALIVSSPEYFSNGAGGSNDGWVTAFFNDALKRAPTSQERTAYDQALNSGQSSLANAALTILNAHEYQYDLVAGIYQSFLDRPGLSFEIEGWTNLKLHAGLTDEQAIASIVGDVQQEYYNKSSS